MSGLAGPSGGPGRPPEPLLPPVGSAERDLAGALADLWEQRRPLPACRTVERDCDLWLSNKPAERTKAANACQGGPVVELCLEAAEELGATWGVWGGRDFTPPPGPR